MADQMFPHLVSIDLDQRRAEITADIDKAYKAQNHHVVKKVEQRNILLIGRTRTGKSTIKKVMIDPRTIADEMKLAAQTRTATFESFIIDDNALVLNIIDTPGLFEKGADTLSLMDNKTILKTIEQCVAREITKFHLVCFCASFESGINDEDVKAIQLLIDFLGPDVSKNSCLIITRCESKNESQRSALIEEIESDALFKPLTGYFQQGLLFSGSLDRDSWNNATNNLYYQFANIVAYREKLIKLLTNDVEPFAVTESNIAVYRRAIEELEMTQSSGASAAQRRQKPGACSIM